MQSVYYNNGSIRLNRERATMVSFWEAGEVARWVEGLAGIEPNVSEIFLREKITGAALSVLLREDLVRMGIKKLDQQLILRQSIENLTSLVEQLQNESLASLFMRIHSAAGNFLSLLKAVDKDGENNNKSMTSPEIYASLSHLSEMILSVCHWLGRLPFIENVKYINLRQKIIKDLIQIRTFVRQLNIPDSTKTIKSKLILEIRRLKSESESLIRRDQDSLLFSDRYLTRVHLRRPDKNDVNIEFTTMPDFTHVISSIETEAVGRMGTGFGAINVGDEIIEINNQVVIGWDPIHFDDLLRISLRQNEICLLVKKMPRHKEDEVVTKSLMKASKFFHQLSPHSVNELRGKQEDDTRARLMEQEREIEIESDDETLYQSKRSSLKKPDQHSSLPDLLEPIVKTPTIFKKNENPETKSITSEQSISSMKSSKGHFYTFLRARPDTKSIIPEQDENLEKNQPKLVTRRVLEPQNEQISSTSNIADENGQNSTKNSEANKTRSPVVKSPSQISLPTPASPFSSISNFFRYGNETPEKIRKKQIKDQKKVSSVSTPKAKHQISNSFSSQISTSNRSLFSNFESPNGTQRGQKDKRFVTSRTIACKDLGEGDCEGFLKRQPPKGTFSFHWRTYWCVLKAGILFVYKAKDDPIQDIEIKLEGKNISPAPEKRK